MKKSVEQLKQDRQRLRAEAATLLDNAHSLQMQADGLLAQRETILNRVDATAGKIHKLNLDIRTLSCVRDILDRITIRPLKMTIVEESVGDSEVQFSKSKRAA